MATYSFTTFTVPGASSTYVQSINANGDVAGIATISGVTNGFIRLASDGSITTFVLDTSPQVSVVSVGGLNDFGEVAGVVLVTIGGGGVQQGFVRAADGTVTVFDAWPTAPDPPSGPTDIGNSNFGGGSALNNSGLLAGIVEDSAFPSNVVAFTRASDGTLNQFSTQYAHNQGGIAGVNSAGDVAGFIFTDSEVFVGFVYAASAYTEFTAVSGVQTQCWSINDSGVVVGSWLDTDFATFHGFIRQSDGTISSFDAIAGAADMNAVINNAGVIAGYVEDPTFGFYYGYVRDTDGTITTFSVPGDGNITRPAAINDSGWIAGSYDASPGGFIAIPASEGGDFALAVSNTDLRLFQESEYLDTVTVTSLSGYSLDVDFTLSGSVPIDVAYAYTVNPVPGGSGFTGLYFNVGALAATGIYSLAVVGEGTDGTTHFVDITLTIVPPPSGTTLLTFPKQSSQVSFIVDDPLSDWYVRVKKTDPYGEGDWSETLHILQEDFIDSGFLRGQGSIIPSLDNLVSELFTYTSTSSAIDISWPNFTLEYADASTQFVLSGSFDGSGLSPNTTYNVFPKVFSTNGSVLTFDEPNGHSAFVPSGSADLVKAANDVQADGWISLAGSALSFQVKTAAGGGTGGGGGGGGQCPVEGQMLTSTNGDVPAEEAFVGMAVKGADPVGLVERWAFVQSISRSSEQAVEIELDDGSITCVSSSTPVALLNGEQKMAGHLRLSDALLSAKSNTWIKIKRVTGLGLKPVVRITLSPTQWFFVGGVLTHNTRVVKGGDF